MKFCLVIADEALTLHQKGFEGITYTPSLMNRTITTAKRDFLLNGDKEQFTNTCFLAMKAALQSLMNPMVYNSAFDSLIDNIKIYARQFNFTRVEKDSIGLFHNLQAKAPQSNSSNPTNSNSENGLFYQAVVK